MINYQGLFADLEILGDDTQIIVANLTDTTIANWIQNTTINLPLDGRKANTSSFDSSLENLVGPTGQLVPSNDNHLRNLSPQDWHDILGEDAVNLPFNENKETPNTFLKDFHQENEKKILSSPALLAYDWNRGPFIYLFSLSFVFMGTVVLEGVDTSLLAISAPAKLNSTFLSVGLLTTLMGTVGRCLGDSLITFSAVIDSLPFTDFVNSTFVPLIPVTMIGMYLVRRYFGSLRYKV